MVWYGNHAYDYLLFFHVRKYNETVRFYERGGFMEYITVLETAEKWELSRRSLSHYLTAVRIPGAVKKGRPPT